ncbi:MAG TPA: sigma-70 family RNA polymerase sigma factor [Verrucomicrobiae bacterium]|nr:sigma-70 family RNA polymerase sigma factor [Verrucomicrobiae bacterium]
MASLNSTAIPLEETAPLFAQMVTGSAPTTSGDDAEIRRITAAVAKGDAAAFEELYDRYHLRLLRLLVALTRGDEILAQETLQSVMLTAAAKLKVLESEEHLWNWLARVARQHLGKVWRQQKREPMFVSTDQLAECTGSVESDALLERGLDKALLELEAADRQLIEWTYFDGLSQKAIAERLETTPKAVSSRLERVRARLRASLKRILSYES